MKSTIVVRSLLLLVVFGSLGVFVWRRVSAAAAEPAVIPAQAPAPADPVAAADVVVTYFTTDVRCDSCRKIEALSRRAVLEGFPDAVLAGRVLFRMINTDRPEHRHYLEHYEIANKTVIVSHQRQGKEVEWTGRQDVWLHLDEPETFFAYVREPIAAYLAAK